MKSSFLIWSAVSLNIRNLGTNFKPKVRCKLRNLNLWIINFLIYEFWWSVQRHSTAYASERHVSLYCNLRKHECSEWEINSVYSSRFHELNNGEARNKACMSLRVYMQPRVSLAIYMQFRLNRSHDLLSKKKILRFFSPYLDNTRNNQLRRRLCL